MPTIETEKPHWCRLTVYHGEDWYDAIPQFIDGEGEPYDLTGKTLALYMRPTFGHAEPLLIATNGDGILIEDAASGYAAIFVSRADVSANLPVGSWEQFLNLGFTDGILGAVVKTIWRGPLVVHPGNLTA